MAQNPKTFCTAFVQTSKCDVVNNMAETFNGYIIQARAKHIIYMLEDLRCALMTRLYEKRQLMIGCADDEICLRIKMKLEKAKEDSRNCHAMPSTNQSFQVRHIG